MTTRHLRTRLASLFRRARLERELGAELQYHIDMLVDQNIGAGMPPAEARRAARRARASSGLVLRQGLQLVVIGLVIGSPALSR